MSTIAATVQDEKVYMIADSLYQNKGTRITGLNAKIAKVGDVLFGVAGSCRISDYLFYSFEFKLPCFFELEMPDSEEYSDKPNWFSKYLRNIFVPQLHKGLKEYDLLKQENEEPEMDADILIGFKGSIYEIACNLSVIDCEQWGHAIGSGCDVARGVLYTYKDLKTTNSIVKLKHCITAAEYLTTGTRRPFYVVSEESNLVTVIED